MFQHWRRPGDKLLSEPMMVKSRMRICVTRPHWVNSTENVCWQSRSSSASVNERLNLGQHDRGQRIQSGVTCIVWFALMIYDVILIVVRCIWTLLCHALNIKVTPGINCINCNWKGCQFCWTNIWAVGIVIIRWCVFFEWCQCITRDCARQMRIVFIPVLLSIPSPPGLHDKIIVNALSLL